MDRKPSKKPSELIYGVDESPPFGQMVFLGLQHVCTMMAFLVSPLAVANACNLPLEQTLNITVWSMILMGVGTLLQGIRKGPLGSGYLCPEISGATYIPPAITAVQSGGLALLNGMQMVGGLCQALIAPVVPWLRRFFPSEVTGVIVLMVGITIIPLAVNNFFYVRDGVYSQAGTVVGMISLGVMVAGNVWGKRHIRQFCLLIGIIVGYIVSIPLGILEWSRLALVASVPFVLLPQFDVANIGFDYKPVIAFLIISLSQVTRMVGNITTCQKINDTEWKRPDMKSISGGVLSEGASNIISSLFGGFPLASSSSSIGLSLATAATSRRLAYSIALIFFLLALLPQVAVTFALMPQPVMGACLIFNACFIVLAGFQIMMSRMIDARKTFTIGLSLLFGLSVDIVPGIYDQMPSLLRPFLKPSFSFVAISVILLNMLFRIGVKMTQSIEIRPGEDHYEEIFNFFDKQGKTWGCRKDVIVRVVACVNEFLESAVALNLTRDKILVAASFDEFNLDVKMKYSGSLMVFSDIRPTTEELFDNPDAPGRLSGYLIHQLTDRASSKQNGTDCTVLFHFKD